MCVYVPLSQRRSTACRLCRHNDVRAHFRRPPFLWLLCRVCNSREFRQHADLVLNYHHLELPTQAWGIYLLSLVTSRSLGTAWLQWQTERSQRRQRSRLWTSQSLRGTSAGADKLAFRRMVCSTRSQLRKRGYSAWTSSIPFVPSPPLYIETKKEKNISCPVCCRLTLH